MYDFILITPYGVHLDEYYEGIDFVSIITDKGISEISAVMYDMNDIFVYSKLIN